MEGLSWTTILSVYGAVLSTIAFVNVVYRYRKDREGKLKLSVKVTTQMLFTLGRLGKPTYGLEIRIVNAGLSSRFFEQPLFEFNQRNDKYLSLINIQNPHSYPVELRPGEEFKDFIAFSPSDAREAYEKIKGRKYRLVVKDTIGKEYSSKWYSVSHFKDLLN